MIQCWKGFTLNWALSKYITFWVPAHLEHNRSELCRWMMIWSVLWIRTHFFRIRIHKYFCFILILIRILIFWPEIFFNGAFHCFHLCFGICTTEKKVSLLKNVHVRFLSFKCLICDFSQIYILQKCLGQNPNPNPNFFSDSDPAKIFGLFRIRIHTLDLVEDLHRVRIRLCGTYAVMTSRMHACLWSTTITPSTSGTWGTWGRWASPTLSSSTRHASGDLRYTYCNSRLKGMVSQKFDRICIGTVG
jgi:hypothetical protein